MAGRDLEVDVYEFLQRIQLEQFFEKLDKLLHLTRLSHFDHVAESDLSAINMSKPEQRRLFDAIKKHKKERKKVSKLRFSLTRVCILFIYCFIILM
jgi:curved DNA-binding protein CbpA